MKPPKTLPLASGAAICVLTLLVLGIKAINKSRDHFLDDLTSKSIDGMNSKALDTISSELRAHEAALQELHESQHKDSFVPAESSARRS